MIEQAVNTRMATILRNAYAHPEQAGVYYSANGAETGSARLNAMPYWDWTPAISLFVPGVSTALFPLALGCAPSITSEGCEWIAPLFHDAGAARTFIAPDIYSGRSGEVLVTVAHMLETLADGQLIRIPDIQSPLGVAELMWDESFYVSLLDEPAAVHHLLQEITHFEITFIQEVKRLSAERLNAVGFPCLWGGSQGTFVADDTMSLLSPVMHLEFSVPYLNAMSDACGGLHYHSCTWREQYFANLQQLRHVHTFNWNPGNSTDPAVIMREFSGQAVLTPHICHGMHQDTDLLPFNFPDEVALLRYILDQRQHNTCLYFWFSNICANGEVMERIYDLLDQEGCTPRAYGLV